MLFFCSIQMSAITVRFSQELDYFLAGSQGDNGIVFPLDESPAVKHPIETLGVPHTEVGHITINGKPDVFSARVHDGDVVFVYGIEDAPPNATVVPLRPPISKPFRFVLDTHLGKLARHLRLLGFDARYDNTFVDSELAAISAQESRILLTRDRGLLKHRIVVFGYCLRTMETRQQLRDVVRRYGLASLQKPYARCLACNSELKVVPKAEVLPLLEPKTRRYFDEFKRCPVCQRIYWRGSHTVHLDALLESLQSDT